MKIGLIQVTIVCTVHLTEDQLRTYYDTDDLTVVANEVKRELTEEYVLLEDLQAFPGSTTYSAEAIEIDV
jgi:hypothetical protein